MPGKEEKQKWLFCLVGTALAVLAVAVGCFVFAFFLPQQPLPDFAMAALPQEEISPAVDHLLAETIDLENATGGLKEAIAQAEDREKEQQDLLASLAEKSKQNKNLSDSVYEEMIVERLGEPIYEKNGTNSSVLIFELAKEDLRGYMAKVKLKTDKALRVTLAPEDKINGETTLAAANRTGAILAINGGGFATSTVNGVKTLVPMGNTMIEGKLINEFLPSWNDLAFAGFSKSGKLVGGIYDKEEQLEQSGAWQGVSFVPVLVKDWEPVDIPQKWANARQPRTVLGQYPNGDIFFIVVDGRQSNWSNGITLEEMQILLLRLGVMEAFNLDGGGSSTFVYNGKVLNKPSDGSSRKLATNIVVLP